MIQSQFSNGNSVYYAPPFTEDLRVRVAIKPIPFKYNSPGGSAKSTVWHLIEALGNFTLRELREACAKQGITEVEYAGRLRHITLGLSAFIPYGIERGWLELV